VGRGMRERVFLLRSSKFLAIWQISPLPTAFVNEKALRRRARFLSLTYLFIVMAWWKFSRVLSPDLYSLFKGSLSNDRLRCMNLLCVKFTYFCLMTEWLNCEVIWVV